MPGTGTEPTPDVDTETKKGRKSVNPQATIGDPPTAATQLEASVYRTATRDPQRRPTEYPSSRVRRTSARRASGTGGKQGRPESGPERELEDRTLVPVFDRQKEAPERCCLITTAASRQRPEVRAFREWVLEEARGPRPTA